MSRAKYLIPVQEKDVIKFNKNENNQKSIKIILRSTKFSTIYQSQNLLTNWVSHSTRFSRDLIGNTGSNCVATKS